SICSVFSKVKVTDRRSQPTFGYRAIHLIVVEHEKKIEIQVRTLFQHRWAQYSEALADRAGHELKYGGGHERLRTFLENMGEKIRIRELEFLDLKIVPSVQQINSEFQSMLPLGHAQ
ncbi:MAG: hypothetical protein HC858_10930, partial [Brachymonas sp.]|nr:hypothetical protein [Brachymonas sp.]